jgi:translation elongation factor EF-4
MQGELSFEQIESRLMTRFFTLGRRKKGPQTFKSNDIEVEGDITISTNQCYFAYVPATKQWYVQDGQLNPSG